MSKRSILGVALGAMLFFSASVVPAHAAGLTDSQISAILSLLQSFGADQSVITNVNAALHGSTTSTQPTLALSDSFVSFYYTVGDPTPPVYLAHIFNQSTTQSLSYNISVPNQPAWLNDSYATQTLTLSPGQAAGIGVYVDPSKVSGPGTYTYPITFTGSFANAPVSLPVTLVVRPQASTTPVVAPSISSMSPTQGSIGSMVTVKGAGFVSGSVLHFGNGYVPSTVSSDGTTLSFKVPSTLSPYCAAGQECANFIIAVMPNTYNVWVTNANGTSNTSSFVVTSPTITTVAPSISIVGKSGTMTSSSTLSVSVGSTVSISGTPTGLSGLTYGTGKGQYTRAFFFDPIFSSCTNNSATDATWTLTCMTKTTGSGSAHVEIYKDGVTYKSNIITVSVHGEGTSSSSLMGAKYSGYGNQTMLAGTSNARLGAFTLSAGSTEGVTVNTVVLILPQSGSVTNLTLKDDATGSTMGSVITTPSGTNSFSINTDISAASTKTFDVYGNILANASGNIQLTLGTTTSGTGDTSGASAFVTNAVPLQTITVGAGSLKAARGAGDPVSANIIAGTQQVRVGQFTLTAQNSAYTVQNLQILIPTKASVSIGNVTVSYKDANGATQTATQTPALTSGNQYATATFNGLSFYVPMNDSANLDVYVSVPTVAQTGASGASVSVALDQSGGFKAVNSSGSVTSAIGNSAPLVAGGTFYIRKSIPTVSIPSGQGGSHAPSNPLYRFTITADPAGAIEWSKVSFAVAATNVSLANLRLVDESTGQAITDGSTTPSGGILVMDLTKNSAQPQFQQVAAGSTKTYDLMGSTITSPSGSATLSLALTGDTAYAANTSAGNVGGNFVWSDRSAASHTISTLDWTNGYLVQNFSNTGVTYSYTSTIPTKTTTNTTTSSSGVSAVIDFTKHLYQGITDPEVALLQNFLNSHGYSIPDAGTNFFGSQTANALEAFQAAHGLPAVGEVGPLTRSVLNQN